MTTSKESEQLRSLIGLTIRTAEFICRKNGDDQIEIQFEDGTELVISGIWQNDQTAGLYVSVEGEGK